MTQPSALEQFMLELINAERVQAGVQPLASDGQLNDAAEQHSQWMIDTDTFSHTGAGGSTPTERMAEAGVDFSGSWASGENIGWTSSNDSSGYQDEVQDLHTNLMNSPGHRENILNPDFREVGIGFATGDYQGGDGAFVTENFARTGTDSLLTGVAFADTDGDKFYDPGEGLGGISVKAVSAAGEIRTTTTFDSGGYDLALPAGAYEVTFSGPGIAETTREVTLAASNIKLDLVNPASNGAQTEEASTSMPDTDAPVTGTLEEVTTTALPASSEDDSGAPADAVEIPQLPAQDASALAALGTGAATTDSLVEPVGQPLAEPNVDLIDALAPAADLGAEGTAPQIDADIISAADIPAQENAGPGPDGEATTFAGWNWADIAARYLPDDAAESPADDDAGEGDAGSWWDRLDAFDYGSGSLDAGADDRPDVSSFEAGLGISDFVDELEACITGHTDGAHQAITEAVSSFIADLHSKLAASQDQAV